MRKPNQRYFGADVDKALVDEYEQWAEGRGKIDHRQLLRGLFRLFLAAPESLKLEALHGKGDLKEGLRQLLEEVTKTKRKS